MNCKEIEHKLIFYIEGDLPENEQQEISSHLKNCKSCSQKLAILKESYNFIETEKKQEANAFIATQIIAKIKAKSEKQKSTFIKILQPLLITAFLILAVWVGNIVSNSYSSIVNNNYQVQNAQTIDNTEQFAINDISYKDYYFISAQ